VALAILDHLDKLKYLDNIDSHCPFALNLVLDHLVNDPQTPFNSDLAKKLIKILRQQMNNESQLLLSYLMQKVDKSADEFTEVCELKYMMPVKEDLNEEEHYLNQLAKSLSSDLPSKSAYIIQTHLRELSFTDICSKINFANQESFKRLSKIMEHETALDRFKQVRQMTKYSREQFVTIKDLVAYCSLN